MDSGELLQVYNNQIRKGTVPLGFKKEITPHTVRHVSTTGEKGFISFSSLDEENANTVIEEEMSYFKRIRQAFEWKVYSYDQPLKLKEVLMSKGFKIDEKEALMVMDLDASHPFLKAPLQIEIKEITDMAGIDEIVQLENEIWNEPHEELGERLWRDKQSNPDFLYLYGVYQDGRLVSGAWVYLEKDTSFASLWGGSTLSKYRGKGYYTALLVARAKKAYESGRPYLTVDASTMSRPILEKAGFQCLAYSYGCQSPSYE
ncbi:GNAT family N-acetyltransferase [Radiobacillus kanasensis]|uniref:GNAT family N-acetyltransferase n=1 Tax=Radiobacillus kanasensis TaxID=2844358 RepID=UPI001E44C54B|nr:GNAT family N-acetyltransferase [Radiobacillus kanasensis]UFT98189.1 GNAT family N-acetyltransferase [Radiobacillus kanasensis]